MYYYGARYYDPRLSIFISVDPLAEEFVGWTPYHYVHNNPINLIDPTGMAANGWIEWTTKQGDKQMTYDQGVDTKEDAIRKGYKNVESVIESGYYNSGGDSYELKSDGKVINEHTGQRFDVTQEAFRIEDGTYFQENRSTLSQFAEMFTKSGDAAIVVGTVMVLTGVGAPAGAALITYGGYISTAGTAMELVDEANKGKLTEEKVVTKG